MMHFTAADMNAFLNDDMLHTIDSKPECTHCGMHIDPLVPCLCCKKTATGRVLRDTTSDIGRVDYTGLDDFGDDAEKDTIVKPIAIGQKNMPQSKQSVLEEFHQLLLQDGYHVGKSGDGTAVKYCRYMKMLFDSGVFSCREDFFGPSARSLAHATYVDIAKTKAHEGNSRTTWKKLYKNYANGFDKFVLLAKFESSDSSGSSAHESIDEYDNVSVDDILAMLA